MMRWHLPEFPRNGSVEYWISIKALSEAQIVRNALQEKSGKLGDQPGHAPPRKAVLRRLTRSTMVPGGRFRRRMPARA